MYCHQCGKEVTEDSVFCRFCGTNLKPLKQETVIQETYKSSSSIENREKSQLKKYATAGLTLGIISICTSFTLFIAIVCGIIGIVFSALGSRSKDDNSKATIGLVLSILGICLPILVLMLPM